jgi:hypothetical protein
MFRPFCTILALCLLLPAGATALPFGGLSSSTLNLLNALGQDGKPGEIFGGGTSAVLGSGEGATPPSMRRRGGRHSWTKSTEAILGSLGSFSLISGNGGQGGGKHKPTPPVPEPGTVALFGGGIVGLALLRRRSRKA